MKNFLRENWLWIAAPILIVMLLLVGVAWLVHDGDLSNFVYNLF